MAAVDTSYGRHSILPSFDVFCTENPSNNPTIRAPSVFWIRDDTHRFFVPA